MFELLLVSLSDPVLDESESVCEFVAESIEKGGR